MIAEASGAWTVTANTAAVVSLTRLINLIVAVTAFGNAHCSARLTDGGTLCCWEYNGYG